MKKPTNHVRMTKSNDRASISCAASIRIAAFSLLALSFWCGGCAGSESEDGAGDADDVTPSEGRIAVVVGISRYSDSKVNNLMCAADDADSVASVLRRSGWCVTLLKNEDATRGNIQSAIQQGLASSEYFLFYFAGHGTGNGYSAYLCPADTAYAGASRTLSEETLISGEQIQEWLAQASGAEVAIVLDSCFSGSMADGGNTVELSGVIPAHKRYLPFSLDAATVPPEPACKPARQVCLAGIARENCRILAACGPDEIASEDVSVGHGVFTYQFLKALDRGSADANANGWVDIDEASAAIAANWPSYRSTQTPRYQNGNAYGAYELARL